MWKIHNNQTYTHQDVNIRKENEQNKHTCKPLQHQDTIYKSYTESIITHVHHDNTNVTISYTFET